LRTHIYGCRKLPVKTTIDLPDDLLIAAKKRAAERRTPLRAVLEAGLRAELGAGRRSRAATRRRRIRWVTVRGGTPPGCDVADRARMHDWLLRQR
jgi:hypothetical protein